MVGWVNQKSTRAIFYDLRSEGRKIIKFVHCDQGVLAHATAVYLQHPVGSHDRLPLGTRADVRCSAPSLPETPLHGAGYLDATVRRSGVPRCGIKASSPVYLPTGRLRDTRDRLMIGRLGHCAFHRGLPDYSNSAICYNIQLQSLGKSPRIKPPRIMFRPVAWVRLPDPFRSWSKNPDDGARQDFRMRNDDPKPESDQAEFGHIGQLPRRVHGRR